MSKWWKEKKEEHTYIYCPQCCSIASSLIDSCTGCVGWASRVQSAPYKTKNGDVIPCHFGARRRLRHLANIRKTPTLTTFIHPALNSQWLNLVPSTPERGYLEHYTPQSLTTPIYIHCLHQVYSVHMYTGAWTWCKQTVTPIGATLFRHSSEIQE